jgi:hypothetical protein
MNLAWLPVALASGLALGAQPSVSIEVDVLGASDQAPKTAQAPDAAKVSTHLERDLRTTLKFKHYRELAKRDLAVVLEATGEMTLPNGGQLQLTPLSFDPVKGMLELRVRNQKEHYDLDTEYSIKNGGTLFVTAGPFEQEVLVVAITPRIH